MLKPIPSPDEVRQRIAQSKRAKAKIQTDGHGSDEDRSILSPHVRERDDVYTRGDTGAFPDPEWPAPLDLVATPGIAGEFVSTLMPHTEADPAALLFSIPHRLWERHRRRPALSGRE